MHCTHITRCFAVLVALLVIIPAYLTVTAHRAHAASPTCTFFVNQDDGNDNYNGQAPYPQGNGVGPWKDMTPVNQHLFVGSDALCFQQGDKWTDLNPNLNSAYLQPQNNETGSSGTPVTIQSYCDSLHYTCPSAAPIINGNGDGATIELYNQQFWTIQNLVIRNWQTTCDLPFPTPAPNPPPAGCSYGQRSGILVEGQDYPHNQGAINSINLNTLDVHDVLGQWGKSSQYDEYTDPNQQTGGITFEIYKGQNPSKTWWNNVQVTGNQVSNVYRNGIHFHSDWSGNVYPTQRCDEFSHGGTYPNYTPSTQVVVENNIVHDMGGDGVSVGVSDSPTLANNVVYNGNLDDAGGVGVWTYDTQTATNEHNTVFNILFYNNKTQTDADAFDTDYCDVKAYIEYNFSFGNAGGFVLAMPQSEQTRVRYNISQNDGPTGRDFIMNYYGSLDQAQIYDNSIYMQTGTSTGLVQNQNDTYKTTAPFFKNNAIRYDGSGDNCTLPSTPIGWVVDYNDFYGPNCSPPIPASHNVNGNPTFQYPGQGGYGSTCVPTGCYDPATAYTLGTNSAAFCLGTQIPDNGGVDYQGYQLPSSGSVDAGALEIAPNQC